jgi:aldose 1-epimerase
VTDLRPSGRAVELVLGDQRAIVVEVGGGLREYTSGGEPIVDGYPLDRMASGGRGQLLIPWPNRIADGTYQLDGTTYHLPLSEPDRHNAIHGLVRWANWTLAERQPDRAVMAYRMYPQPGYPFLLDLTATYRLTDDGLDVTIDATNRGTDTAPFGAGAHPYLLLGSPGVDRLELAVPASTYHESDARGIPVGRRPVDGSAYDFRRPRPIGSVVLDTAFTDLIRGPDGRAVVELVDPVDGRRLSVWCDAGFNHLMLFTGDTLLPVERRRAVAVEPMTCAPNAFQTGDGRILLAPGESTTARWGITPPGRPL